MSYQILRTLPEVESLEGDWRELISEDAAPFVSFGWNLEWLKSFQSLCDEILVFVFYEDDAPLAIFPLYRKEGQVRFIGDGCSHHQDFIARDAGSVKWAWRVVMGYVRSEGCSMVMPKVTAKSLIAQVIVLSADDIPLLLRQERVGFSPCLRVSRNGKKVNGRSRATPPGVKVRFCEGREIMDGLIGKVAELHCEQYRARGEVSLFENDVFQRFVRATARREDAGSHLATFEIEGRVVAFVLGFSRGGIFYVYASGMDERYRDQAPDRYLWSEILQRLGEEERVGLIDISCNPEATGATAADAEYELLAFSLRQKNTMNRLFARTIGFLPPSPRADGLSRDKAELYGTTKWG